MKELNATTLAYLGDALYELRVRETLVDAGVSGVNKLHRETVKYVSAKGQAAAAKSMMDGFLTEEETIVLKKARNQRAVSRPKNADPREYKVATGFEALLGHLYVSGQTDRLNEVMNEAMRIIDEA
jgi:ribonuclease-3 family protein